MSANGKARRVLGAAALLVTFGLAVTGCTAGGSPAPAGNDTGDAGTPRSGGDLKVLLEASFAGNWQTGLDPATSNSVSANLPQYTSTFGGLFQLNADKDGKNARVEANQAESSSYSKDGLVFTLKLRKGITFSDGSPLNADAVLWNWIRDLSSGSTGVPNLVLNRTLTPAKISDQLRTSIISALPADYDKVAVEQLFGAIRVVDDLTIEIHFAAVNGAFVNGLPGMSLNWMASPTGYAKLGAQKFKEEPIGAGPFIIVSDTMSQKLSLKRNPHYFKPKLPYLNTLSFQAVAGDQVSYQTLQAGQAGAIEGLGSVPLITQAQHDPKLNVVIDPPTSPYVVQLNTRIAPFNDERAREAIYYATDYDPINKGLFKGQGDSSQSFTASGGLFYNPKVPNYRTYDLAKAKALVKEIGGLTVKLDAINSPVAIAFVQALQTQWTKAGINVSLRTQALGDTITTFKSGQWTAYLQTAGAFDPATGIGVTARFGSLSPYSGAPLPKGATSAADAKKRGLTTKLDDVLNEAQATVDPSKRDTLYKEAAQIISDNAYGPFGFAFSPAQVVRKGVHGPGLTTPIPGLAVRSGVLYDQVWVAPE